jgi:putative transposase
MTAGVGSLKTGQVFGEGATPVSPRVSPTERLPAEIDEVFASAADLSDTVELVARLGARLLLQAAIEAEVTVFLGRDRYARPTLTEEARPGMRNGYCDTRHCAR